MVRSSVRLSFAALLAACAPQPHATVLPVDLAGLEALDAGPPSGVPTPSSLGAALAAVGLSLGDLPPLAELSPAQLAAVMQSFTVSLGLDCSGCHLANPKIDTPEMRVARRMWDELVRALRLADGQPIYCDSCHAGHAEYLDRSDLAALGQWMQRSFVEGLRRRDVSAQTCASCHGDPFDPSFLDAWARAPDGGTDIHDAGDAVDAGVDLPTGGGAGCTLLINEVQVAGLGSAADEFVELYNPCDTPWPLRGNQVVYRSADGQSDITLVTFPDVAVQPGARRVLGNAAGFLGPASDWYTGGLASHGGGIALRANSGVIVDAVGWGDAQNAFVMGHAAPAPPNGYSIARQPDGARGTGDNSVDFVVGTPTPAAAN